MSFGDYGGRYVPETLIPALDELERGWDEALGVENVGRAVAAAAPWGVDVARGVEAAPGIKDHDTLRRFVAAAKEAGA